MYRDIKWFSDGLGMEFIFKSVLLMLFCSLVVFKVFVDLYVVSIFEDGGLEVFIV